MSQCFLDSNNHKNNSVYAVLTFVLNALLIISHLSLKTILYLCTIIIAILQVRKLSHDFSKAIQLISSEVES